MATRYISNGEIKDEDIDKIVFNLNPSCDNTLTYLSFEREDNYFTLESENNKVYVDKRNIPSMIEALKDVCRLCEADNNE